MDMLWDACNVMRNTLHAFNFDSRVQMRTEAQLLCTCALGMQ